MSLPDLESLRCVEALARTLRFSDAARVVALSPAPLSARIQSAEAQLGAVLFHRTTRRVSLTSEGEAALPRIKRLLDEARELRAGTTPRPADIVIGTRHELGMSWVMPARAALRRAFPHLTVHLRFGGSDAIERGVVTMASDAAITSRLPLHSHLRSIDLHQEEYALVAAPALLRERTLIRLKDAAEHTLIDVDETLPLSQYARHQAPTLRFKSTLTLGTIDAVRVAVLAGEGVAILPSYFVADDLRRRRQQRVLKSLPLGVDAFRLVLRDDDQRQGLWNDVVAVLRRLPLR